VPRERERAPHIGGQHKTATEVSKIVVTAGNGRVVESAKIRMPPPTHYIAEIVGSTDPESIPPGKVKPQEFLIWAEKDLSGGDERGRGNALGNVKKALHSRLDEIIGKTHLRFTRDWHPKRVTTKQKLDVIRQLGMQHEAIIDVMTSDRNDYEHDYIVPAVRIVRAYLHAAQLWVEKSYAAYEFRSVAFAGIPLLGIAVGERRPNGSALSKVRFGKPQPVLFFSNSKKGVLSIKADGVEEWRDFKFFDTKEMLRLEAPLIRRALAGGGGVGLNEASLMDLLECYRRWVRQSHVRKAEEWIVPS
jgi:hypothetical protein